MVPLRMARPPKGALRPSRSAGIRLTVSSCPQGVKKPYNPILGEYFDCSYVVNDNIHIRYIAEQVSHHPPMSAFHVECKEKNFSMDGHYYPKSRFLGNSVARLGTYPSIPRSILRCQEPASDLLLWIAAAQHRRGFCDYPSEERQREVSIHVADCLRPRDPVWTSRDGARWKDRR